MSIIRVIGDRVRAVGSAAARFLTRSDLIERTQAPHLIFGFKFWVPRDVRAVLELRAAIAEDASKGLGHRLPNLYRELASIPLQLAWQDGFRNTVMTGGMNNMLTNQFTGSAYTAAWYLGLISSTSYSAPVAGDTMASHSGWEEFTGYSNSTRPAPTFGTASSGSIATSAAVSYSINAAGTVEGGFAVDNSTISGTTGNMYSAGAFSGGSQDVSSGGTLDVNLTESLS